MPEYIVSVLIVSYRPTFISQFSEKMARFGICVSSFDCEPKVHYEP